MREDIPSPLRNVSEVNEHFSNLNHLVRPVEGAVLNYYRTHKFDPNIIFTFRSVTEADIQRAFNKIKSIAVGFDNIGHAMLDWSMPFIVHILKDIMNQSFESAEFPNIWKTSVVKPIPQSIKCVIL